MSKDSGKALAELAVDGGMTNSDLCMQVTKPSIFLSTVPLFPPATHFLDISRP
jgi:hypothetical protein